MLQIHYLFTVCVLLSCTRFSLSQDPTYNQLIGNISVRLVQDYRCTESTYSVTGRVEVFIDGVWGTICRNRCTQETGNVLCRKMGYDRYKFSYGLYCERADRDVPMQLSYIDCNGDEDCFEQCEFEREFPRFCRDYYGYYHARDLALTCYKKRHDKPRELPLTLNSPQIEIPSIPLQSNCSGVVNITYNGVSGFISSLGVADIVGTVICEQLGFYRYLGPLPPEYLSDVYEPILLAKPECTGRETNLKDCPNWGWGPFPNLTRYPVLSVQCACKPEFECGDSEERGIRLRSKINPCEGRLEVKVGGEWGSVCSFGFTRVSAKVACRQLGYRPDSYSLRDPNNGGYGAIKLREVDCDGDEKSLLECPYKNITSLQDPYCRSHYTDVMLRCEAEPPEPQVRLVETVSVRNRFGGSCKLLEFRLGDEWYPHCCEDESSIQYNLATVCREASGMYLSNSGCTEYRSDVINSTQGSYSCEKGSCYTDRCNQNNFTISHNCTSRRYTYVCCSRHLPDLVPDMQVLLRSLGGLDGSRSTTRFYTQQKRCAVEDGCLAADANVNNPYDLRNVIRFSTQSNNLGTGHFKPPVDSNQWVYHNCHKHYHSMEHFVDYTLKSSDGLSTMAAGHKASFCLEDSGCHTGGTSSHRCGVRLSGNQGISPRCYDLYSDRLDCQWIDVTATAHGTYRLEIHMNPSKYVPESDFSNNKIVCVIKFFYYRFSVQSCEYEIVSTPGHS